MAKQKQQSGAVAIMDEPAPELGNYRINLRCRWTIPTLTMEGCTSEEDARAKLHEYLDAAIIQIEKAR